MCVLRGWDGVEVGVARKEEDSNHMLIRSYPSTKSIEYHEPFMEVELGVVTEWMTFVVIISK